MSRSTETLCEADIDYDDADFDFIDDLPSHVIWISGICIIICIILLQYCILRCSKAVKTENINSVLIVGALITFLLSALSIHVFQDI